MNLGKYSFGIGDRFGQQGKAQLAAILKAKEEGVLITPVWNKSYREHEIIGSTPKDTRIEADNSVKALGWKEAYFVDADHIGMKNVDFFLESSNFFTIDVADFIGTPAEEKRINLFVEQHQKYFGMLTVPGIEKKMEITKDNIQKIARKYLYAIEQAGKIYAYIYSKKGSDGFVVEVSMDEVPLGGRRRGAQAEDPQAPPCTGGATRRPRRCGLSHLRSRRGGRTHLGELELPPAASPAPPGSADDPLPQRQRAPGLHRPRRREGCRGRKAHRLADPDHVQSGERRPRARV